MDVLELAGSLNVAVGQLVRRLRSSRTLGGGEPTMPETQALSRLDRGGPTTSAELARKEQISPQSMGVTLAGLEARGLVERGSDESDGRRVILSLTTAGHDLVTSRRTTRSLALARALEDHFTDSERATLALAVPLIERLAEAL